MGGPYNNKVALLVAGGVGITLLAFAWFTNHAWEDYYITLRSSRNLVEGHGLVFNAGERVHTFTSPLGVLVPAVCTWLTGPEQEIKSLWLFRILNALTLAAAAAWAWRRFNDLGFGGSARVVFYGLAFLDAKLVDFSINGMETAILVAFLLWLWAELERLPAPRPWAVAVGCGGLLWTRPDACILGAALLVPHLIFRHRLGAATLPWRPIIGGVLLGGLLYLPWFSWAWWYYGSPIPHTIIAKGQVTPPINLWVILKTPWLNLTGASMLRDIFLPTYWFYGGWPRWLSLWACGASLLASMLWLLPWLATPTRRISLTLFLGSFYFCSIILFPWYSPPWTVVAAIALAGFTDWCARAVASEAPGRMSLVRLGAGLMVGVQLFTLTLSAWEMRHQQRIIENGIRRDIGLWLREHAKPGDTVFMECLGYIGYFSGLKTYDYPGLSSPEVVAVIGSGARRFTEVIGRTQPDWLVLRPIEIADVTKPENSAWLNYELIRDWDARHALDDVNILPGRDWLHHDARFFLFRRKKPAVSHSAAGL